jgi:hypothetical protein
LTALSILMAGTPLAASAEILVDVAYNMLFFFSHREFSAGRSLRLASCARAAHSSRSFTPCEAL